MPLLNAGDPAPDFKVKAHTGETISLADQRGSYVLLWFYPKADTPGCTIEGCGLRDRASEFADARATIFGVSFDTVEENKAFAEKFNFPYALLCDTERELGVAYGAAEGPDARSAKRISYLIDPEGVIAEVYGDVKPDRHPAEVLEALAAKNG
jgi:thioredoxin-dependent peroxiredoxin